LGNEPRIAFLVLIMSEIETITRIEIFERKKTLKKKGFKPRAN